MIMQILGLSPNYDQQIITQGGGSSQAGGILGALSSILG
jgi:hypothetical protein